MEKEIINEITGGANVEKTLAKYFGLSVTKDEVQMIKTSQHDRNKINIMIKALCSKSLRITVSMDSYKKN